MNVITKAEGTFEGSPAGTAEADLRKVLVVDDDPAMRRLLSKILDTAGYQVATADNGFDAIAAMQDDFPSFVITDWDMPVLDGAEFCRRIRQEETPHYVYIVMLTGSPEGRLVEGLAAGADDFITKPVKAPELLARMQAGARVLRLENRLRLLASHDPLTNLLNRRAFFELLATEWKRSSRIGYPLSCVMIDVDFFKRVNDTHGHLVGDEVLKSISWRLEECCRATDCVCRYGGEEFCVMLPDTDEQGVVLWAQRCRSAVAEGPLETAEMRIRVTISLGVAQRRDDTDSPEKLLDLADRALLEAKRLGRDRVVALAALEPIQQEYRISNKEC